MQAIAMTVTNDIYDDSRFLARLLPTTRGGHRVDVLDLMRRFKVGDRFYVTYVNHLPDGALLVRIRGESYVLSTGGTKTWNEYTNG